MTQNLDKTNFLNVDLDIHSKTDLRPLVDAMGDWVLVLFAGRVKRHYEAHLELAGSQLPKISHSSSPEWLIRKLCKLVQELPAEARNLWDAAKLRSFNIGIQGPARDTYYWSAIGSEAIRATAELDAGIGITVYGPMRVVGRPRRKKPASRAD